MANSKSDGHSTYSLRLDGPLKIELKNIAKRRETTQRALIEEALREFVLADVASRMDAALAPMISQVIQEHHQVLGKGFRSLVVRLGYEMLRTEYVLCEFATHAGIPASKVGTWREEGWRFAVKEFRQKVPEADE